MLPPDEKERLIESLAECEEAAFPPGEMADSTTLGIQAQLETLQERLREAPPAEPFREESACDRVLDAVKAIGRDPSFTTRQQLEGLQAAQNAPSSTPPQGIPPSLGTLGQYRLLAKLGEGGMGAVYKALHTRLDKIVALKVLTANRLQDRHAVSRFDREMRAVGKLHHVNIVAAHDAGEIDGTHYLVMELVEGIDLGALVKERGRLPIGAACELIRQAALGLQHAHEHNLVHRDIKPSNLMLTLPKSHEETPTVKVLDLGLALLDDSHLESAGELTTTGQVMGTIEYMAPEQGTDTHTVDIRADIYSLGASLYKLLAGKAPFPGEQYRSPIKLLMASATQEPPPVANFCPEITPDLAAVIHRMLAKKPDDRYATPRDVAIALAPFSKPADVWALIEFLKTAPADERVDVSVPTFVGPSNSTNAFAEDKPTQPMLTAPTVVETPVTVTHRAERKPVRRGALASLAIAVFGVVVAAALYQFSIQTPQGELIIQSDVAISVNIKSDGKDVAPGGWNLKTEANNKRFIRTGQVEIELPAALAGEFTVTPSSVILARGKQQIVRIEKKESPQKADHVAKQVEPMRAAQPAADLDRSAAQWWIDNGGTGMILQHDGKVLSIKAGTKLPKVPFLFRGAYSPPPHLTNEGLQHLAGLSQLSDLGVAASSVDAQGLESIQQLPRLRVLDVTRSLIPTSELHRLRHLPFLNRIEILPTQVDDQWRFASELKSLRTIRLYGYQPVLADFLKLGESQGLREITLLDGSKPPNFDMVAELQRKNPTCRVVDNSDHGKNAVIGVDPVREAVLKLLPQGLIFRTHNAQGMEVGLTPESIRESGLPVSVETIIVPPQIRTEVDALRLLASIPAIWLYAGGLQQADAFAKHLPDSLVIGEMNFINSDLTDEGLRQLHRLAPFSALNVDGTKVTEAGIGGFRKALPMCTVISKFGTFQGSIPFESSVRPSQANVATVDRERAAAELWQKRGGGGSIRFKLDRNKYIGFTADSKLPTAPFELISGWGPPSKGFSNLELEHFSGLAALQRLGPTGEDLDAFAIQYLARMHSVRYFELVETQIPSSVLDELNGLPHLSQLWISGKLVDDNWNFVEKIPALRKLWISHLQPTPADLRRLAELTQLREIRFVDAGELDAGAVADLQRKNPQCRLLTNSPNLRTFGADPVRECVRQLIDQRFTFLLTTFDGVGTIKSTAKEAVDDPQPFNLDGLHLPADLKPDKRVLNVLSGIPIHNFAAADLRNADAVAAVLPDGLLNNQFGLVGSDLTDKGLAHLHRYPQLVMLNVLKTKVTRQGIDAFRKAVPFCEILSDFGTFPADFSKLNQPSTSHPDVVQHDRERAAVELWQQRGGGGSIRLKRNGEYLTFLPDGKLPDEPFDFISGWGYPAKGFTNAELQAFVNLADLEVLMPLGDKLDLGAVPALKQMTKLYRLNLENTQVPSSALSELKTLPFLTELWLSGTRVDDNWKFAEQLPGLRKLCIFNLTPTNADWQRLSELRQMRELRFFLDAELDPAAVAEFQHQNPRCRLLSGNSRPRSFGIDPVREAVRRLVDQRINFYLEVFDGVGMLKPTVKEVLEDPQPFNVGGVILPPDLIPDAAVFSSLSVIPFRRLEAVGLQNADGVLAALPEDLIVRQIELSDSDLTDQGLLSLKRFTRLSRLDFARTKVTISGIQALHKAVPTCAIYSDLGTFKAIFPGQMPPLESNPEAPPVDRERAATEWVLAQGGQCLIVDAETNQGITINPGDKLPKGKFTLLSAGTAGGDLRPMQNSDLERFEGLSEITRLRLVGPAVDGRALRHFTNLKSLLAIDIHQSGVATSALRALRDLPFFHELTMIQPQVDDNWDFLGHLPTLYELVVDNHLPTLPELEKLATFPQLRSLYFYSDDSLSAPNVATFQRLRPGCRLVIGYPATRKIMGTDPVRKTILELFPKGFEFDVYVGDKLHRVTQMDPNLPPEPQFFLLNRVLVPSEKLLTQNDLRPLVNVSCNELTVTGRKGADALLESLPPDLAIFDYNLSNSDLTDTGLARLHKFHLLKTVYIQGTQVTKNGVERLRINSPDCYIVSDFGGFKPDRSATKANLK